MRKFMGSTDDNVIIIKKVFPGSSLEISTPFEAKESRLKIFIEGELMHQQILFDYLKKLVKTTPEERNFGEWVGLTPPDTPDENPPRIVMYYESFDLADRIQLLCLILPRQLARFCDLCLCQESELIIKKRKALSGPMLMQKQISLVQGFANGNIFLPKDQFEKEPAILFS